MQKSEILPKNGLPDMRNSQKRSIIASKKTASQKTYWSKRNLIPEYQNVLTNGEIKGNLDSTQAISEERDLR